MSSLASSRASFIKEVIKSPLPESEQALVLVNFQRVPPFSKMQHVAAERAAEEVAKTALSRWNFPQDSL